MDPLEEKLRELRRQMVQNQLVTRGISNPRVLDAFAALPRERFCPPDLVEHAYDDQPLPIGEGQTISQPFVVALSVQELGLTAACRVLDVGAGSGYQTAILAGLARHVYAIERIDSLRQHAAAALADLNVDNVTLVTGDGSLGWPQEAPFDRIICGAAAPAVPQAWIDQLADGGRLVAPVGGEDSQTLLCIEKRGGDLHRRSLGDVRFVKLIGRQGWEEP